MGEISGVDRPPAKALPLPGLLSGVGESLMLVSRLQEADMVADSNSQIAWHRAQIKKHRAALKQIETARHNYGEIAGSKSIAQTQKTVAELKRKIRDSEQVIAAHERQTRRPLTTDFQTLASVPWSRWNTNDSSDQR
jgi:hypothetical protein